MTGPEAASGTAWKTDWWEPPTRPDWVTELNRVGVNHGSPARLVDLRQASLLEAAVDSSGGLEGFGDDAWREGFRLLVDDVNEVADLNLIGRLLCRSDIVRSLRARLEIADAYRRHPEIDDESIEQPVVIAGPARSGTTILIELLAQDPVFRPLRTAEILYPYPPPVGATSAADPRLAMAGADQEINDLVTPEFRSMHENRPDAPNECHIAMQHEFVSGQWMARQHVPNYQRWLATSDGSQGYRFHRRFLKLLQWQTPGRWLLKGPGHLGTLPALFAEYPDARVIITHRDPLKTIPSLFSLMVTLRRQRTDTIDYDELVTYARTSNLLWERVMEQRHTGVVPDDQIIDLRYGDLMRDPIPTIAGLYERLGVELSADAERRMRAYLAARPKDRHGAHRYSFDALPLDREATRRSLAAYMKEYGIEEEP